ncbi:MAG: hypothetical protein R3C26_27020 [Calditrichia bacterium]
MQPVPPLVSGVLFPQPRTLGDVAGFHRRISAAFFAVFFGKQWFPGVNLAHSRIPALPALIFCVLPGIVISGVLSRNQQQTRCC